MTPGRRFTKQFPYFFLLFIWLLFGCGSFGARSTSSSRPLTDAAILATSDAIRARTTVTLDDFSREATSQAEYDDYLASQESWEATKDAIRFATHDAFIEAEFTAEAGATETAEFEVTIDAGNEAGRIWWATQKAATAELEATENAIVEKGTKSWIAKQKIKMTAAWATNEAIYVIESTAWAEWATRDAEFIASNGTIEQWPWATEYAEYYALVKQTLEKKGIFDKETPTPQQGCSSGCIFYPSWCEPPIKGNVSFDDGERIYHMPGDEFYDDTVINPDYDERYFCTPEEAEAAGFRRAYR